MGMNTIIEELDRSSKTIAPEKLQEVIKKIKSTNAFSSMGQDVQD